MQKNSKACSKTASAAAGKDSLEYRKCMCCIPNLQDYMYLTPHLRSGTCCHLYSNIAVAVAVLTRFWVDFSLRGNTEEDIRGPSRTHWSCLCSGRAICGGTLMKRSLSSSPTGLLVSLRICSSCSVTLWVEFFSHWSTISFFTSSTHCTPCQQHQTHTNFKWAPVMRFNFLHYQSAQSPISL